MCFSSSSCSESQFYPVACASSTTRFSGASFALTDFLFCAQSPLYVPGKQQMQYKPCHKQPGHQALVLYSSFLAYQATTYIMLRCANDKIHLWLASAMEHDAFFVSCHNLAPFFSRLLQCTLYWLFSFGTFIEEIRATLEAYTKRLQCKCLISNGFHILHSGFLQLFLAWFNLMEGFYGWDLSLPSLRFS